MTTRHPALSAAQQGWPVFPLAPGEKRPAIHDWETRATTGADRIQAAWTGPYARCGVGIATGPAGLVVVDLDTPKDGQQAPDEFAGATCGADTLILLAQQAGEPMPFDTHTVHTPSGGLHLYFQAPPGVQLRNTCGRLGWLLDTRAHGGYVAAPGTLINGRPYETNDTDPPAPLPAWLAQRLTQEATTPPPAPADVTHIGNGNGYVRAAIDAETTRVRDATQPGRNHALYIAATALGQLVAGEALTADDVESVLLTAAHDHITAGAYDTRQAQRTIASGLAAGAKRPRQVAA